MTNYLFQANIGWQPYFQQQLNLDEWENAHPARVIEHHKYDIEVYCVQPSGRGEKLSLPITRAMPALTTGDWVLLDSEKRFSRLLERKSCFRRKAAGHRVSEQLIAANVDSAFIVCSLNDDFNLNRIERYLSIVNNAEAEPVVILSKMDLCSDLDRLEPEDLRNQVQNLDPLLRVEMTNNLDLESLQALMPWLKENETVVLLGSSGAGKSTLINTLMGDQTQTTNSIREDDSKGRHTTTGRSLLSMPNGAMIIDTPGMRELQLTDCEAGVASTFSDIEGLAIDCRFSDCRHVSEPGCAVVKAIETGELERRRFLNYCKLLREQKLNSASLAERRSSDRQTSRYHKRVQKEAKIFKRGQSAGKE